MPGLAPRPVSFLAVSPHLFGRRPPHTVRLPPEDPNEQDAICRPGRAGLARSYTTTLEALLRGCMALTLAELDAALRATVEDPAPPLEEAELVLARRLAALGPKPREPVMGLEQAAVAAVRQLLAEIYLAEGKEPAMRIDTPIDMKLKSERVQLAEVDWHQVEDGAWESLYPFATAAVAKDFMAQVQDLISANEWPIRLFLEEESILRARLDAGPHGLTSRHVQAIQSLHRLYGGDGEEE